MMGLDETDLLRLAETAGSDLTLELTTTDQPRFAGDSWPELMKIRRDHAGRSRWAGQMRRRSQFCSKRSFPRCQRREGRWRVICGTGSA